MRKTIILALFLFVVALSARGQERFVAFTFDDGPNQKFLSEALPYFKTEGIKVTFFVIGSQAADHPESLVRESGDGHEIENHTYGHVCLVKPNLKWNLCPDISIESAALQIEKANKVIFRITGYRPHFVRPPFFAMTLDRKNVLEKETGMIILQHGGDSIGSLDWVYNSVAPVVSQVESAVAKRGFKPCIIVFHERLNTLRALPEIVRFLRNNGYVFVRLDEFWGMKERGTK